MDYKKQRRINKFNAKKCKADGHTFDSKKEMNRFFELKLMEKQGIISDLVLHKTYKLDHPDLGPLIIKGKKKNTTARYTPDFVYNHKTKGRVIEDVKSTATMTEASKLRIAVFEWIYGVTVTLT